MLALFTFTLLLSVPIGDRYLDRVEREKPFNLNKTLTFSCVTFCSLSSRPIHFHQQSRFTVIQAFSLSSTIPFHFQLIIDHFLFAQIMLHPSPTFNFTFHTFHFHTQHILLALAFLLIDHHFCFFDLKNHKSLRSTCNIIYIVKQNIFT